MNFNNQTLPSDNLSEEKLLGSLIQRPELIKEVRKILEINEVWFIENRLLYETLLELDDEGIETSLISDLAFLKEVLKKKGLLEKIGGLSKLISFVTIAITPSNYKMYVKSIKDKAKRRLLKAKLEILHKNIACCDEEDLKEQSANIFEIADQPLWIEDDEKPKDEKDDLIKFPDVMSGFAGDFAEIYSGCLESPKHFFYMAFFTCLGSLLSSKIKVKTEIASQPRFFTLILGQSADDRKSTAISKTIRFFEDSFYFRFNVCCGIGSAEGLLKKIDKIKKDLEENTIQKDKSLQLLLCFDEFKSFVSKTNIESSVLLPCINTLFESNFYESGTKSHDITLKNVHLSLLAASTVETYQRIWRTSYTDIGFDNRLWLVPGSADKVFSVPKKIGKLHIERLLTRFEPILRSTAKGYEFEITDKAFNLYDEWYRNRERSVYSKRLDGYALRFMPLLAINDTKVEIDEDIVKKAIALVEWQLKVRKELAPIDAENTIARLEEGIRRHLEKGPQSERDLKRKTHANRFGIFLFTAALKNLLAAKEIRYNKGMRKFVLFNE